MPPAGARTGRQGAFVIVVASYTRRKHNIPALADWKRVELHAYYLEPYLSAGLKPNDPPPSFFFFFTPFFLSVFMTVVFYALVMCLLLFLSLSVPPATKCHQLVECVIGFGSKRACGSMSTRKRAVGLIQEVCKGLSGARDPFCLPVLLK